MKKKETAWDMKGIRSSSEMFDLAIWGAYCAGRFDGNVPVLEGREVYEKMKKLILNGK